MLESDSNYYPQRHFIGCNTMSLLLRYNSMSRHMKLYVNQLKFFATIDEYRLIFFDTEQNKVLLKHNQKNDLVLMLALEVYNAHTILNLT